MDDIDREIKLVQLQRERLALERELALKGAGSSAKSAVGAIAGGVAAPFRALAGGFVRWRAQIFAVLFFGGLVAASFAWKAHQEETALKAAEERWNAGASAFVAEQCPESQYACRYSTEDYYACEVKRSRAKLCELEAWSEHQRRVPRPKIP